MRWIGAGLCLVAMPLLSLDQGITDTRLTWRKVLTFAGHGRLQRRRAAELQVVRAIAAARQFNGFMLTTFGMATVVHGACCWPLLPRRRQRGRSSAGAARSAACATPAAALIIVQALRIYEGVVVFPFAEATAVALTVAFAALVWREIPGKAGFAGIAVVTVAAVLINL